ncbi:P-loop containing nucleoside triphosphate hydrolase protein [Leptodontidium sp. 2 PMI_412]|nr:P-loop containing nucleoside triphosphate hydrolase protein [Leptodontidium sp. 2 PMI_412]
MAFSADAKKIRHSLLGRLSVGADFRASGMLVREINQSVHWEDVHCLLGIEKTVVGWEHIVRMYLLNNITITTLEFLRWRADEAKIGLQSNMPGSFQEDDSDTEGEQEDSIVIAVMGVTGAGKSTFTITVSGRNDVVVGDSLCSETSEVRAYEFLHNGKQYILVDTPGFDDTTRSDSQITEKILTWLKTSMIEGTRLNGVIYLHRISDTRMAGTALRNNRMFRKLCGADAFKNIILATTFWARSLMPWESVARRN